MYGLFLAPKIKHCLTINEYGIMEEHKIFKYFNNSKRILNRSQNFNMLEDKKYQLCCLKSGKNHLRMELIYQRKKRFCIECNDKRVCNGCITQSIENKDFDAILSSLKREAPTNLVICLLVLKNRLIFLQQTI